MTPTERPLIRRVLTVVATMIVVAGVIAMHSFMAGHAPMAEPASTPAGSPHHVMAMTADQVVVMSAQATASARGSTQRVAAVTALAGSTSTTSHPMTAMCLAVLPALALLLALVLVRMRRGQSMGPPSRGGLWQPVDIRGSPPRRTTPSLSQLCVLRT